MTAVEAPRSDADSGLLSDLAAWLRANWDPDLTVAEWWRRVGGAGFTAPHFPVEWGGRGGSPRSVVAVRESFRHHGALPPPTGLGLLMAAPTILTHGTQKQVDRFVPPIYDGSRAWCQLFSEPGAGSDLAGLTTRAVRDGDHWVISGEKVWSSMAREADYGMLLARTDVDVPKHAGISWFAFPLDQRGVTIRPLVEITGHALFNEVFLDDAVVDDADLIGGLNNGWAVAQTTLMFERTGIGAGGTMSSFPPAGPKGGFLELRAGDAASIPAPEAQSKILSVDELVDLARACGRARDPLVRQKLARLVELSRTGTWTAKRAVSEGARGGGAGFANVGKLAQTRISRLATELACDILGPAATLWAADGPSAGRYSEALVFSAAAAIYGGTDQIQRNVVGKRALGLPREPDPTRGVPFREVTGGGAAGTRRDADGIG